MLIEWEFQRRGTSKYRNISEWMLLKREMGNGEWEIENGKLIVLFLNYSVLKLEKKDRLCVQGTYSCSQRVTKRPTEVPIFAFISLRIP